MIFRVVVLDCEVFVIPGVTRDPEQKGMACLVSLDPGSQAGVTILNVCVLKQ